MKIKTLLLFLLLHPIVIFAQTTYSRAFEIGFREGYCYNDFGCISPIPPLAPIPYVGEADYSYQDGYNRGFKTGQEHKEKDKLKSSDTYSDNSTNNNNNSSAASGLAYKHDFQNDIDNLHRQEELLLMYRQQKMQTQQQQQQINVERAKVCGSQIKELYSTFKTFPKKIEDGWYNVTVTNYYDLCGDRKVYVSNNKIIRYFIDNYLERKVNFSSSIENAKSFIKLDLGDRITELHDVYFIESIIDPYYSFTDSPTVGTYCFYSDFKWGGDIDIFIEEKFIGKLTSYFSEGTPSCDQDGTVSFKYKPGTYSYKAKSSNRTWSGQITIENGRCKMLGLSK